MGEILFCNQTLAMVLEKIKTTQLLVMPKNKANKWQLFTAFRPSRKFPFVNCSETRLVQAKFKPEVASVTAKR